MSKLWDKGYALDALIERFTVGEDFVLDRALVAADCVGSLAHAAMLEAIGLISAEEHSALRAGLVEIIRQDREGSFAIAMEEEDCHTAIENHLARALGEAGEKVHTGRSRNDQVLAALRLYARSFLLDFEAACLAFIRSLIRFAERHREAPMPGRTHLQVAMPSSVGLWAGAFAEELLDELTLLDGAYALNDACPLGSAASYGVPLPLDRELTARLLGFSRVQNNVLYVNNSRGKVEAVILDGLEQVMLTASKLAQDLILFSLPEFGYFSLPEELFAGSSIMPQKRNPCMLELVRAKAASVGAWGLQIKSIVRALPSGYNRDFQETKGPFLRGLETSLITVQVMTRVVEKLGVNLRGLRRGFTPEIFATDRALELVGEGVPFREAYRRVGAELGKLRARDPLERIRSRRYPGTTGNLGLEAAAGAVERRAKKLEARDRKVDARIESLVGFPVALYRPYRRA